jgi:hypothetical protein
MPWELKSGLGLGEQPVSGHKDRSEKLVGTQYWLLCL